MFPRKAIKALQRLYNDITTFIQPTNQYKNEYPTTKHLHPQSVCEHE
jgi:hypothetical protein